MSTVTLSVSGYKSVRDSISLEIRPLTLIAGTNSSGKSSFMQPFLLMKQSLEAQFDPGPLLITGDNVRLTEWAQAFTRGRSVNERTAEMHMGVLIGRDGFENCYKWSPSDGMSLDYTTYYDRNSAKRFQIGMTSKSVVALLDSDSIEFVDSVESEFSARVSEADGGDDSFNYGNRRVEVFTERNRCFIEPGLAIVQDDDNMRFHMSSVNLLRSISTHFVQTIREIIHVPGLRGNPARSYAASVPGATYPGTIDRYTASIILRWDQMGTAWGAQKIRNISRDLERLGLTWKVVSRKIDDASLRLLVGRLPHAQQSGANDLVDIADVGFGVSQTLPVLAALHVAIPGQIVYVEQPELHLHPRAQTVMGQLLAEAAMREVRVVVETHSSLILRAVQTAIAKGGIDKEDVRLHWFSRSDLDGTTRVNTADLDKLGQFGEWPVDFDDVAEISDWDYLRAVEEASIADAD